MTQAGDGEAQQPHPGQGQAGQQEGRLRQSEVPVNQQQLECGTG